MTPIKVLSVRGYWAHCIIHGAVDHDMNIHFKDVENRFWKRDYRGRLYIHCSGNVKQWECRDIDFDSSLIISKKLEINSQHPLMLGHIIGYVDLVDINQTSDSIWYEGDEIYGKPNFAWVLENPVAITPIKVKGSLGIWNHQFEEVQ